MCLNGPGFDTYVMGFSSDHSAGNWGNGLKETRDKSSVREIIEETTQEMYF